MRAVWVTPFPPDHDGGGGQIRHAHLLSGLAQRMQTDLVTGDVLRDDVLRARLHVVVEVPVPSGLQYRFDLARRFFDLRHAIAGRQPRELIENAKLRAAMASALKPLLPADLVVVEYAALAPLIALRSREHVDRWVFTIINLGSEMAAQAVAVDSARRRRWLYRKEARLADRFEQRLPLGYDKVMAVSDDDAEVLRARVPDVVINVVPNGVDIDRYSMTPLPDSPVVLFVGALYTTPNQDGVQWLAEEIAPRLRTLRPDVQIVVVGARPTPASIDVCRRADLELHADVESIAPFLAQARVAVVPLRIGSGSRLKALEAFAAGRPVVGTAIGLGGLRYTPGRHALVADTADTFAAAVNRLLDDQAAAERLVVAARALVEREYAWPGIVERFTELVVPDQIARTTTMPSSEGDYPR